MATILVVDDSLLSRTMMTQAVEAAGHTPIEAEDGQIGLEMVKQHQPEAVITDLLMPVMGGLEMLQNLRRNGSQVPVIVLSADIQETTRANCEREGIHAFVNKPFKQEQLVTYLNEALVRVAQTWGDAGLRF